MGQRLLIKAKQVLSRRATAPIVFTLPLLAIILVYIRHEGEKWNREDGFWLIREGQYEESLYYLEAVLLKDPADVEVILGCAIAYYHLENYDEARGLLSRVEELQADHPKLFLYRGLLDIAEERTESALRNLRHAEELGSDPEIHFYLGSVYLMKERYADARYHFEQFIQDGDASSPLRRIAEHNLGDIDNMHLNR